MLFDILPQLRVRSGKYTDVPLYMVGDIHDDPSNHEELLKWKWLQYPQFRSNPDSPVRPCVDGLVTRSLQMPSVQQRCAPSVLPSAPQSARQQRNTIQAPRAVVKTERGGPPELLEFLRWCESKHGHLVNTWRKLDKDGNMTLSKTEFLTALRDMGYTKDVQKLWSQLDADSGGSVSFIQFVPDLAIDLARFKHWAEQQFGGLRLAFRAFDRDGNGKLTFKEFLQACGRFGLWPKLKEIVHVVFVMLDDGNFAHSRGEIVEQELEFLDRWKCPPYLWAEPDFAAQKHFRKNILASYFNNPLVAWRKALDKDAEFKVSYANFIKSSSRFVKPVGRTGVSEQINKIYITYDPCRSGFISLRRWDQDLFRLLSNFTDWARREFGKVSNAVIAWEEEPGSGVKLPNFREAVDSLRLSEPELRSLWLGLTCDGIANKAGKITREELVFLDKWYPDDDVQKELAWDQLIDKRFSPNTAPPAVAVTPRSYFHTPRDS